MASLRTAVLQTYSAGNACLSFLHSISSLLSPTYDDRPTQEASHYKMILPPSVSNSFKRIENTLRIDKDRFKRLQFFSNPSLVRITDNDSSDFSRMEQDESGFVHSLELINPTSTSTSDVETVLSENMSLFEVDPTSTANSFQDSDQEFSQVIDI